jgi:hypothetical protein
VDKWKRKDGKRDRIKGSYENEYILLWDGGGFRGNGDMKILCKERRREKEEKMKKMRGEEKRGELGIS